MRILSVCHSVRPSVTSVIPDKMEERSVQIFTLYERTFSLVFWEEEWLVGGDPSTWNFGSTDPRRSKIADFEPIIARSASAVTPSERSSINSNRKSTTRFPMSLRWSSYVAPKSPKGGLKNAKRPICVKIGLRLKKVCYKVSLCENCQRKSCKAFIGLTNRAKMIGVGATPSTWNFGSNWPHWSEIADFQSVFARSDLAVTYSENNSFNTNRKFTRTFQWAQDEHCTLSLSPPKGGSKTQSVHNLNNKPR